MNTGLPPGPLEPLRILLGGDFADAMLAGIASVKVEAPVLPTHGLPLSVHADGPALRLRSANGEVRLTMTSLARAVFSFGDATLEAPDPVAGAGFAQDVARWLCVPLSQTAGPPPPRDPATVLLVHLGRGTDANGGTWDRLKLAAEIELDSRALDAQAFLHVSADLTRGTLSEKDFDFRVPLVAFLSQAVGRGDLPPVHRLLVVRHGKLELEVALPDGFSVRRSGSGLALVGPEASCLLEISLLPILPDLAPSSAGPTEADRLRLAPCGGGLGEGEPAVVAAHGPRVDLAWVDRPWASPDPHPCGIGSPARQRVLLASNGRAMLVATFHYREGDARAVERWEWIAGTICLATDAPGDGTLEWGVANRRLP